MTRGKERSDARRGERGREIYSVTPPPLPDVCPAVPSRRLRVLLSARRLKFRGTRALDLSARCQTRERQRIQTRRRRRRRRRRISIRHEMDVFTRPFRPPRSRRARLEGRSVRRRFLDRCARWTCNIYVYTVHVKRCSACGTDDGRFATPCIRYTNAE